MYPLWDCSPKARAKIKSFDDPHGIEDKPLHAKTKYPFAQMKIGQAFAVPFAEVSEGVLRNAAWNSGRAGKRFVVIKHTTGDAFEVARVL